MFIYFVHSHWTFSDEVFKGFRVTSISPLSQHERVEIKSDKEGGIKDGKNK